MQKTYVVSGMTCAACAETIAKEIRKIPGVQKETVNYATEQAYVVGSFDEQSLFQAVAKAGYQLRVAGDQEQNESAEEQTLKRKTLIGLIGATVLFVLAMILHGVMDQSLNYKIQAVIATILLVVVGQSFVKAVPRFVRYGHGNMNTLVGFGILAAWIYSMLSVLIPQQMLSAGFEVVVYFEAMSFIMAFVHLGKWLELRAKHRARRSLRELLELDVKKVTVWRNQMWQECSLEEIQENEILRLSSGSKIPVDGQVVRGESYVDEAMLSGEPIPVSKKTGDQVFAGTINKEGFLEIRTLKKGPETYLSQIIQAVEQAQAQKAPIQQLADRVSGIFVPIVLILAFATALIWGFFLDQWVQGLSAAIAVLVIACPCALGLATPLAMVVASTQALKRGLLISGADVMEKALSIDTILFDKTGTLTVGQPKVVKIHWLDEKWRPMIVATQQFSEHPLSRAIVTSLGVDEAVEQAAMQIESFEVVSGRGLQATLGELKVLVGSKEFMRENTIQEHLLDSFESTELTRSYAMVNGALVAVFDFDDEIRPETFQVVAQLKAMKMNVAMVSGDRAASAHRIAKKIGLDQVMADTMPEQKEDVVKGLQAKGHAVLMVGDGINDALALSRAELSMAMGNGTDVAKQASDITLVKSRLLGVSEFFAIAKKTMRVAKENLFLSFVYNILCIPLAATGNFPPMFAALAMGLSSLSVVGNSLRLRRIHGAFNESS